MDLNKYTKAELISKLESKIDSNKSKTNSNKNNSITIIDVILKLKYWILSFAIVSALSKIFKNYKSIRAILKFANYIILTMFGFSIFEAFGFGFLVKLFGEFKFILGSIVTYFSNSTFYNYLTTLFNISEETQDSIRRSYNKPEKTDWKAEYEKAVRKRELEEWNKKYELNRKVDQEIDKTKIGLLILLLGGTIATWYYGPELLNIFSPIYKLSEIIKKKNNERR